MSAPDHKLLPFPACWRGDWERQAEGLGLDDFPNRSVLESDPRLAKAFCAWLWRALAARRGRICTCESDEEYTQCLRDSVSEVVAVRVLSLLVRNHDPTLHFHLDGQFQKLVAGHAVRRRGRQPRPDPNGAPSPIPPIAVRLPIPGKWAVTVALAREVRKHRYWLEDR